MFGFGGVTSFKIGQLCQRVLSLLSHTYVDEFVLQAEAAVMKRKGEISNCGLIFS